MIAETQVDIAAALEPGNQISLYFGEESPAYAL